MQVSDLYDAQLDYWTARAAGIPADQLSIELVPRTDLRICVRRVDGKATRYDPSTSPAISWDIIQRERIELAAPAECDLDQQWIATYYYGWEPQCESVGTTGLIAAMRTFVLKVFGDTVPALEFV